MALQWGGWAALAAGAVLCAVGWYGVSGERFAERQIPYLASCTIPGAALIVSGAVLLSRGDQGLAAARVEELYGLLVAADGDGRDEEGPAGPDGPAPRPAETGGDAPYLAVPGGTLYHRPECPLVDGKTGAAPVPGGDGPLAPCPVCEPDRPPEA
ncbi:hypothetical protein [Streptomyces sp. MAR4 CNX-425]|uniref:hypothetical protein n=1 Tax=Streptomyces sp. MAR4 CNX-425 TaxID=3406343 RepID=UPI003B5104C4